VSDDSNQAKRSIDSGNKVNPLPDRFSFALDFNVRQRVGKSATGISRGRVGVKVGGNQK